MVGADYGGRHPATGCASIGCAGEYCARQTTTRQAVCDKWVSDTAAPMCPAYRHDIGRVAAWAAFLDRQQTQVTGRAFLGDRVVAALTVNGIGCGALAAGLTDMQQSGDWASGGTDVVVGGRLAAVVVVAFSHRAVCGAAWAERLGEPVAA